MKIKKSFNLSILQSCNNEHGQSLIEIIVSLGVIGILISAAVAAIAMALRSDLDIKSIQTATSFGQSYTDRIRAITESDWHTIYDLGKGSANSYLIAASGTQSLVIAGEESVLENDVTSGLVGHWKFDETSGNIAYDFSGNGNQGTLTNSPTRTASSSCKIGSCLSFDGATNYVNVADAANLDPSAITIAAWVKLNSASGYPTIVSKQAAASWTSPYATYNLRVNSNDNKFEFWANNYGSGATESTTVPQTGVWVFLAGTYDGQYEKIYVNGGLEDTTVKSGSNPNSSYNLAIGSHGTGSNTGEFFPGLIDDVRIYNRALSPSEVTQLYSARVFTRKFYVDNVSRDSCGSGNITANATTSCTAGPGTSGVTGDPSTQKITVGVGWEGGRSISETQYVSRTRNKTFIQTNWSGGSGQTGTITEPNNRFSSSTNINYATSTGSIVIQGF